ncbi:hypothetical protein BKA65DRAFT_484432 [Rhexocercosporidium sp. MPI-PUGE-AT-0058]|nr:hypothetical protein BKA65DRAFT_484432 [Rhexocercosporidium sp. MPI-PUGE-AT-0058]
MEPSLAYTIDYDESSSNSTPCLTPSASNQALETKPESVYHYSPFKIFAENASFRHEENSKYARIMDAFSEYGVGKDLDHPRFVLVGSRSCGKSSLLENLTGIDVPVSIYLGTSFPIEINLVRDTEAQTTCTIEPDEKASDEVPRAVAKIMDVLKPLFAHEKSDPRFAASSGHVSCYRLRVEMRGPMFPTMTFIDTPELPQGGSSNVNTKTTVQVEDLVTSLIKDPKTIIITAMEATAKIESQKMLDFAEAVDPNGTRTISVMTKCDLVDANDADQFQCVLRRSKNEENKFQHDWHLVKNRTCEEVDMFDEAALAKTKGKSKMSLLGSRTWHVGSRSVLDTDRIGVTKLRDGLVDVLCARTRVGFPGLSQQASELLPRRRKDLESLGPDRSTLKGQREYMKTLVREYQGPKTLCLDDGSGRESLFATSLLRDLTTLGKAGLKMRLEKEGPSRPFQTPTTGMEDVSHKEAGDTDCETSDNIYTWISCRYQSMKWNTIPGVIPPALVDRLFEEQTANWSVITSEFITEVQKLFVHVIEKCLDRTCQNARVAGALKQLITTDVMKKLKDLRKVCDKLMENERDGLHELAGNKEFVKEIQEARTIRFLGALARLETPTAMGIPSDSEPQEVSQEDTATRSSMIDTLTSLVEMSLVSEPVATDPVAAESVNTEPVTSILSKPWHLPSRQFGSHISGPISFAALRKGVAGKSVFASELSLRITSPCRSNPTSPFPPVAKLPPEPTIETTTPVVWKIKTFLVRDIAAPKFGEPSMLVSPFTRPSPWRKVEQQKASPLTKEEATSTKFIAPTEKPACPTPSTPSRPPITSTETSAPSTPTPSLAILAKQNFSAIKGILTDDHQVIYQIHDVLKAYYDISIKSYADAVCKTGLNEKFVREVMDVFCEGWIDGLNDEQVRDIALESINEKRVRRELKEEVERLEKIVNEVD